MKTRNYFVTIWLLLGAAKGGSAATHYVDLSSPDPTPPYTNWITAATVIQDAVDAALDGDDILVTNGVYQTGGREVYGMSNRVAVTKSLTVRSVNGPAVTSIVGRGPTEDGIAPPRCVYLTNAASLAGFTLTGGATESLGAVDQNSQSGGGVWCESASAVVSNCVLTGNWAFTAGGGAYSGTLNNCTLTTNSAGSGGGAYNSVLNNCTLTGNSAWTDSGAGGGAAGGTLNNCTLTANSALGWYAKGGGASDATLNNCTLTDNSVDGAGGGASSSTLNHCSLTGNSAHVGGGAWSSTLNNCTLTGNSATETGGGGVSEATLNNCIVYYNAATTGESNYQLGTLSYCCTTPLPMGGVGNITSAPLFVDLAGGNLRLQSHSPCINAGNNAYAPPGPDLDGNPRIVGGTVDIGAYEYQSQPFIQTGDGGFGVRTNQFRFNIAWASGQTVVVEACTNLHNPTWFPVATNTLTGDSSCFSDPQSPNYPARFYRLRSP